MRTKLLDLGEPKALLALAVDPPKLDNICKTISTLKEVGALFLTANGKLTPHDGDLSYLGRVIARLPLDVHLGKLIMLGKNKDMQSENKNLNSSVHRNEFITLFGKVTFSTFLMNV